MSSSVMSSSPRCYKRTKRPWNNSVKRRPATTTAVAFLMGCMLSSSTSSSSASSFVSGGGIPQHRVRSTRRTIPYDRDTTTTTTTATATQHHSDPYARDTPPMEEYDYDGKQKDHRPSPNIRHSPHVEHEINEGLWSIVEDAGHQQRQRQRRSMEVYQLETSPTSEDTAVEDLIFPCDEANSTLLDCQHADNETILPSQNTSQVLDNSINYKYKNLTFSNQTSGTDGEIWTSEEELVVELDGPQPIRLRAILTEGEYISEEQRHILMEQVMRPALHAWSAALRVWPVVGPLRLDPNQLYDGETCGPGKDSGLPSVFIPPAHFTEGLPETDLVIYISLAFLRPPQQPHSNETLSNETDTSSSSEGNHDGTNDSSLPLLDENDTTILITENITIPNTVKVGDDEEPQSLLPDSQPIYGTFNVTSNTTDRPKDENSTSFNLRHERQLNNKKKRKSQSINNDEPQQMLASLQPDWNCNGTVGCNHTIHPNETAYQNWWEARPICSGDYLASATYCSTDQLDRPVAGMLHFCIGDNFFDPPSLQMNILTAMHEVGHVLGFNAQSLAHFRRSDGSPITPRDTNGDVPDQVVECTGISDGRVSSTLPLPSPDILQFRNVRGGLRVAEIVTPTVRQVTRNHFNCHSLAGAELESEHFHHPEESCLGDHWARRIFRTDLMNPVIDDVPYALRISPLTLAYFVDSGWYHINLRRAAYVAQWGRGTGCAFVESQCITPDGTISDANEPFFCNNLLSARQGDFIQEIHGCTADFSRKAVCSMGRYNSELPLEFQYFNSTLGPEFGGTNADLDYCPIYEGFVNGLCKDESHEQLLRVHPMEEFGKSNSRCIAGNVGGDDGEQKTNTALCLPIACCIEDRSLRIKVDGNWQKCNYGGERKKFKWNQQDYAVCPDPFRTCPTFYCPRDCLGYDGAECDYTTGKCMCPRSTVLATNTTILESTPLDMNSMTTITSCSSLYNDSWFEHGILYDSVARMESSLSEYYVASSTELKDDEKRSLFTRIAIFFSGLNPVELFGVICLCILSLITFWVFGQFIYRAIFKSRAWLLPSILSESTTDEDDNESDNDDEEGGESNHNPNKDKMVASMLWNLRVHDPSVQQRLQSSRPTRMRRQAQRLVERNRRRRLSRAAQVEFGQRSSTRNSRRRILSGSQQEHQQPTQLLTVSMPRLQAQLFRVPDGGAVSLSSPSRLSQATYSSSSDTTEDHLRWSTANHSNRSISSSGGAISNSGSSTNPDHNVTPQVVRLDMPFVPVLRRRRPYAQLRDDPRLDSV